MRVVITSGFGEHDSAHIDHLHKGIDLAMAEGTPVRAFESGIVERVTNEGAHGFGNAIWLRFPDGYHCVLGHLDQVYVKEGEHVYNTEIIARSGSTGHSTGPHLHVGIQDPTGHWIDPARYIEMDQILHPQVMYGSKDWADHVVSGWFNDIGTATGNGVKELGMAAFHGIDSHMPQITISLLVVAGFMYMIGAKKWGEKLFIAAGVGTGWVMLF